MIYFGRSLDAKGKNNPMALPSAWVYWFKLSTNLDKIYICLACIFMAFKKSTWSGSIDMSLKHEPRGLEFPEVGCFFGDELILAGENILSTRKHLLVLI